MTVYSGPSFASDALVDLEPQGRARRREGPPGAVRWRSTARRTSTRSTRATRSCRRTLANPGTWGYERDVFQKDWDALPEPTQDVGEGQAAGQGGRRDRQDDRHRHQQRDQLAADRRQRRPPGGDQHRAEGQAQVGLGRELHQLLHRPQGAQGRRRVPHRQLPRLRRPGRALQHVRDAKGGSQNYDGFEDPRITAALEGARTTTDQTQRAQLTAKAGDLIMQTLPWIPLAAPDTAS